MLEENKIPELAKNDPKFRSILETLEAYHDGKPISAHCPNCSEILVVTVLESIDTIWVSCSNGCTSYREKYAHGALARKNGIDINSQS